MPGLEMPTRGGGAAMLRELRDEERPSLQDTLPQDASLEEDISSEEAAPSKDSPSQNLEAPPAADQLVADRTTFNPTTQSYDSMTNHMTDKQTDQKASKQADKPVRKKSVNVVSQKERQPRSQSEGQSGGQSVADMIRQRAAQRGEQEVLKTVTLKLSPSLDEKIERYCFDHKMKKQEFWAEAAALYFEMIAEGEEE